jgi:hypothetical protein
MPHDEPDWTLITRPSADPRTIARVVGVAAMALGVVVLGLDALRPGFHLDASSFGFGLIASGGLLWR